jgi:hypothetical protein
VAIRRPRLEALVAALLEVETLDAGDIYRASDLPVPGNQVPDVPALG